MNREKLMVAILAGVLIITAGALASGITAPTSVRGETNKSAIDTTVIRDSSTVLLDGKTIPAMDYIHLYDATPYKIMNGHVAAKLPCDTNSMTPLIMLVGFNVCIKSTDSRFSFYDQCKTGFNSLDKRAETVTFSIG
jgi:hypothetical protein